MKPFIAACLLLSSPANAASIDFFKHQPIYSEPLAAPRSINTGALTVNTSRYLGQRIAYLDGVIGANIPIVTTEMGNTQLQFGVQGATWLTLGYTGNMVFPLLTQDFHFAFPLSLRYRNFSSSVKINHISAHLGDGMDILLKEGLTGAERDDLSEVEDIVDAQGLDISLASPKPYSRDYMSFHLSYDYKINDIKSRSYVHGGYVHKMIPKNLGRWFVGSGFEAQVQSEVFAPYISQDVTWNEDTDSVDQSVHLGAIVMHGSDSLYEMRIAFTSFIGYDRRGQMLGRKLKQFGFGMFFRRE